jgi:ectoine hydroxylase-related dioxygenase (phytanoyl-CoA dioxygenase family)
MCHHHPYFKALVRHPAIYDVVAGLYESGVRVFSDTLFMKPARHGIEAAPHQDTAFWPKLRPNAMNFWMAIDAATVKNGCLHVVPGTHARDLPHQKDPVQGNMLREDQFEVTRQVPIELEPGGAIFFDSALIHRSYANRSDRSRRAYTVVYGAENQEHVEPWRVQTLAGKTPQYEFELIEPVAAAPGGGRDW